MDLINIEPTKPIGFWNTVNPWSYANKQFKENQKIWMNKNSSHIDIKKVKIKLILKVISNMIGILITLFFTLTPWLIPKIPIELGIGNYNNFQYNFSWPDHLILSLMPFLGHIGVNLTTKLGNYGKIIKYSLIIIPIIITSPYLIYQLLNITKHKKYCTNCQHNSQKIQTESKEN